jgi:hypothetical protein
MNTFQENRFRLKRKTLKTLEGNNMLCNNPFQESIKCIRNQKEEKNMRTTKIIWLKQALCTIRQGMLALGMLSILCLPQLTVTASAADSSHHSGWYHGSSYIAEKEIRENEQKAEVSKAAHAKHDAATESTVDPVDNEEEYSYAPEETED